MNALNQNFDLTRRSSNKNMSRFMDSTPLSDSINHHFEMFVLCDSFANFVVKNTFHHSNHLSKIYHQIFIIHNSSFH